MTVVGWTLAAALGMLLVYGPHKYIIKGAEEWSLTARVTYGMLERFLWALVLSWVVYACHLGGGGRVKLEFIQLIIYQLNIFRNRSTDNPGRQMCQCRKICPRLKVRSLFSRPCRKIFIGEVLDSFESFDF